MRKTLALAIIAAASTATSACGQARSEDGGPTVARNYQVGAFDQIEVAGPYDVTVRTGSGPTVSAQGPQKMIEHMVVEVRDGKLEVHGRLIRIDEFSFDSSAFPNITAQIKATVYAAPANEGPTGGATPVGPPGAERGDGDSSGAGAPRRTTAA